jgi:hypothetical protein
MPRLINQGGNPNKFRPYVGRKVPLCRTDDGFEPLEAGRVRMRDKRLGWNEFDNVTFAPLRRWLAAQVGRPWAEVYAELPGRYIPTTGQSPRAWAAREVAQNCWRNAEGALVFNASYGGVREVTFNDFYVDPETGRLLAVQHNDRKRAALRRAEQAAERAKVFRQGKGNLQYHKREGIWYEVTLGPVPEHVYRVKEPADKAVFGAGGWPMDTFLKKRRWHLADHESMRLYGAKDVYAVSHRTLSRKECKRLNLD